MTFNHRGNYVDMGDRRGWLFSSQHLKNVVCPRLLLNHSDTCNLMMKKV